MNAVDDIVRLIRSQVKFHPLMLCLGVLWFTALVVMSQDNASKADLPSNGSFELEKIGKNGEKVSPEGWDFFSEEKVFHGSYVDDKSQAHTGEKAVSITGDEAATGCAFWLSDLFEAKPGAAYSVEGWIRTAGCTGKGAWLWVNAYETKGQMEAAKGVVCARPIPFVTGAEDWRDVSMQIMIPKNIRFLRIGCRLDGPGAAWFDDIKVSKVE